MRLNESARRDARDRIRTSADGIVRWVAALTHGREECLLRGRSGPAGRSLTAARHQNGYGWSDTGHGWPSGMGRCRAISSESEQVADRRDRLAPPCPLGQTFKAAVARPICTPGL